MGVFTEYFAAQREQITDELVEEGPFGHIEDDDLLQAKGIDPAVKLAQLGEQLTGTPFLEIGKETKDWASRATTPPEDPDELQAWLAEYAGAGASVYELRDELRDAIAAVADDELLPVARRWVTIEEFGRSTTAEDLRPFLGALRALCRRAQQNDLHLYCWWSL